MKIIVKTLALCCLCGLSAQAQKFEKKFIMPLDEPLRAIQLEWLALDSDTLLDVALTGISQQGELKIKTYQNKEGKFLELKSSQSTGYKEGFMQVADWNKDNTPDLLIAGKTLIGTDALFLFENKNDFTFLKSSSKLSDHAAPFRVADMNQDGNADFLLTGIKNGEPFLRILSKDKNEWLILFEVKSILIKDLLIFDFNKDQKNDFVISGETEAGEFVTRLYLNKNDSEYVATPIDEVLNGKLSIADFNQDGWFDLYGIGKNLSGEWQSKIWTNQEGTFTPFKSQPSINPVYFFTGDFNSDGNTDQLIQGINSDGQSVIYLTNSELEKTELDALGIIAQRMGDFDRDGDLDLLQIKDSVDLQWIKLLENKSSENKRPDVPKQSFAISVFNKTFILWKTAGDDHTAGPAITYDVWLGTADHSLIAPSFNVRTGRRTEVRHGNAGTNASITIRALTDSRYYYLIQSVDNAFNGSYGMCGGGVLPCFDLAHENIQACKGEMITLHAVETAGWYSTSNGFLVEGQDYQFIATANDTIFSVVPQGADCAKNKVWTISVHDGNVSEKEVIYTCQDKIIRLEIPPGWHNIEWKLDPVIYDQTFIEVKITQPKIIVVTAKNDGQCTYRKEFTVGISKPELEVNDEVFRTLKGNSVQLMASGTVTDFSWEPPLGLTNTTVPNPIATPIQTTEYTVTGTDSVGCITQRKVRIEVEETAFVPNLFTPNNDGKNDTLLIFGLTSASGFKFQIFNRQGVLVYETSSVSEATTLGWNGYVKGSKQPSGIYYWKVEGKTNEENLLLNGKKTGSILLVN